jgi:hypothetical protein
MRELASVQIIKSLSPIEGADKIEKAEVLGWEIVVQRNQFVVGEKVILCEIDSILPELPPFEFLRPKKFRIKTCKLRGCISQGIAFPLSTLTQIDPSFNLTKLKVGQDLTDTLKITKYDPEAALDEPQQVKKSWLANKWSYLKWKLFGIKPAKNGNDFPTHLVPKTDEIRVQKMGSELTKREGELVYITEKAEGASCTFVYRRSGNWLDTLFGRDYIFQVCSRNRVVYDSRKGGGETNRQFFYLALKYSILHGLKKLDRNLAIQGECIGPGVQGNIYHLPDYELKVFLIYDLDKRCYVPYNELVSLVKELKLPMVPVVDDAAVVKNDIKYYVELSKGNSVINPKVSREGIVIRSTNGDFSFKSINSDYLLNQHD